MDDRNDGPVLRATRTIPFPYGRSIGISHGLADETALIRVDDGDASGARLLRDGPMPVTRSRIVGCASLSGHSWLGSTIPWNPPRSGRSASRPRKVPSPRTWRTGVIASPA